MLRQLRTGNQRWLGSFSGGKGWATAGEAFLRLVLVLFLVPSGSGWGSWQTEMVDSAGWVGWCSSLAIDEKGMPHVSYCDYANCDLKYAYRDGDIWRTVSIDSEGKVGGWTSLAIDRNGYPHVSYYDWGHQDLRYAYRDDAGWHVETVDSLGNVGRDTSIALDEMGCPHICYHDFSNDALKYARMGLGD